MCHCHIKHSFVCTGWGQHTQRGQQLRVYLCIWAGQEVFPPWLTQADGVSQLWDCELSLVMSGLCLALASFFTRHWTEVEQGCWVLPCGVSLARLVCVTACGFEEQWPAHRGEGWDWIFVFCSAGTKVFGANTRTACKRDTKTGICPLFNRLDDPGSHYWGCIQYKARDNTITPAFLFPTPPALFGTRPNHSNDLHPGCAVLSSAPSPTASSFLPCSQREAGNKGHLEACRVAASSFPHHSRWMEARLFRVGINRWSQLSLRLCWIVVPRRNRGTSSWSGMLCYVEAHTVPG